MEFLKPSKITISDSKVYFQPDRLCIEESPYISYADYGFYTYYGFSSDLYLDFSFDGYKVINKIRVASYYNSGYEAVKTFKFVGIDKNNEEHILIKTSHPNDTTFDFIDYEIDSNKGYTLYRLYIIDCHEGNGGGEVSMARFCMYGLDSANGPNYDGYISHKRASLAYILPMNTTQKILAKTNDTREGLLGMANDQDNYGDLYIVGKDRKSHLAKASMKCDTLFEGNHSGIGQIVLSSSIFDYKYIVIETEAISVNRKVTFFSPSQLEGGTTTIRRCEISGFYYDSNGNPSGVMWINVTDKNKLNVIEIRNSSTPNILRVTGIK